MKTKFTKKENSDSGLALIVILLIGYIFLKWKILIPLTLVVTIILMIYPEILYPFTILWLNFSDLLGKITSRILLSFIFFIMVFPVALIQKMMGKDLLKLKQFKKDNSSVFKERNHKFTASDLENPF
jgi:hypothetical protein